MFVISLHVVARNSQRPWFEVLLDLQHVTEEESVEELGMKLRAEVNAGGKAGIDCTTSWYLANTW